VYSKNISELLAKINANYGDFIKIEKSGRHYEGILMPPPEIGDSDAIIIKLKNGYNIGVSYDASMAVSLIEKSKWKKKETKVKLNFDKKKSDVALISTGGTITSKVDYETGGVSSLMKAEELISLVPEIVEWANLEIVTPFSRMSESISPKDWQQLAKATFKELKKRDAIIITHGTDTLHYTAAALSFMIRNLNKPIILTAAQRSSDRGSTDAALNLLCSSIAASKLDIAEVSICMHANISDDFCYLLRGTKVRKMHSSARNAFRPINTLPIAEVWPDGKINILSDYKKSSDLEAKLDNKYEEKVALVKIYPGINSDVLDYYIDRGYKGLILEAFGLGHVPTETREKKHSLYNSIKMAIERGIFVGFAAQTLYGSLNPYVYSSGRKMLDLGVVYLKDMLPEVALVKLGWVLAHSKNIEETKALMLKNIAGEFNDKITAEQFLY